MPIAQLRVVAAPSRSRPRLAPDCVAQDMVGAHVLAGRAGVVGFTESAKRPWMRSLRGQFGPKYVQNPHIPIDTPIGWTHDWPLVYSGTEVGCRGLLPIAPARNNAFGVWVSPEGLRVGVIATHPMPGGWAAHPSRVQRARRGAIRQRWNHQAGVTRHRVQLLAEHQRCDVVFVIGDINRPGDGDYFGTQRIGPPGLIYIGVWTRPGVRLEHGPVHRQKQWADHAAYAIDTTIRKG